ncbi:hypothetical protein Poli38472_000777 [Pythium oligandrum]|uniref:Ubiquitin-like domain-containing protein n=1 Tax=Pythium oligandrum TaxID=41045 RepID=A0A8K1FEN4_PYTOL|nr:hypothetical protein Poli38472_000777 [Pythium oligandrum]|eukprot:TMW60735.1 hypothetical protein Poli38472_000777 [Pythium oligandrum]
MGRFLGSTSPRGAETTARRGRGYESLPASNDEEAVRRREHLDEGERDGDDVALARGPRSEDVALARGPRSEDVALARGPRSEDVETDETHEETVTVVVVVRQQSETTEQQQEEVRVEAPQRVVDPKDEGEAGRGNNEDNNASGGENAGDSSEEEALEPGFIRVRILDLNGKFFNIACQLEWTVLMLKEKVVESTEVAITSQRLIYRGRVLEDDHQLAEYKLEDGHTVHLFVRMNQTPDPETAAEGGSGATAGTDVNRFDDGPTMTFVHISSETISSAVFPSDSARRVDPLMLDSPLGNCARRVKLWSSFLLIIYTMKVMGQFALLANDQQVRASEETPKDDTQDRYYNDRYDYPPYYNQDPMISVVELMIHAFGVYVGCVGFKAAHDTDIRPIRFYCRGVVWLAILTVAEQILITYQISQSDFPETRIQYAYGPAAPSKEDIVSANIFQTIILVIMWILAIHHSYAHQGEVARYNESFAAAAMNAVPPPRLADVV